MTAATQPRLLGTKYGGTYPVSSETVGSIRSACAADGHWLEYEITTFADHGARVFQCRCGEAVGCAVRQS